MRTTCLRALLPIVVIASGCFGTATLAAASSTSWSAVASPNVLLANDVDSLAGISCVSDSACMAVGHYSSGSWDRTFAEWWDGTRWSVTPTPDPTQDDHDRLASVSCVSKSYCVAVGSVTNSTRGNTSAFSADQPLIETWNGSDWSPLPAAAAPQVTSAELAGVACVSATECTAVGSVTADASGAGVQQALIEDWNGAAWLQVPAPASPVSELSGVSCTAVHVCTAVGGSLGATGVFQTLVEVGTQAAWAIVPSPNQGVGSNQLEAVSCPAATFCAAVGTYAGAQGWLTLSETWNGAAWLVAPSADAAPDARYQYNGLSAVSCPTATSCAAVGTSSAADSALAEHWSGSSWELQATPQEGWLAGVSCPAAGDCIAAGSQDATAFGTNTLVERTSGLGWTIVPSADHMSPPLNNVLYGVSCPATNWCAAVGDYTTQTDVTQTLIQMWSGGAWTIVPSPNRLVQGGYGNSSTLAGVSCPSTSFCMAVGQSSANGGAPQTLAESWNGTAWSIVPSPSPGSLYSELDSVSCTSATFCTAVGLYEPGGVAVNRTLIETWNGSQWSVVSSPNVGRTSNGLRGVSCTSPVACVAVGYETANPDGSISDRTLVEAWNGSVWTVTSSPSPGGGDNDLFAVSCVSATSCFAAGGVRSQISEQTLIEEWNGATWAVTPSQDASQLNTLTGVSCLTPSACTAVGFEALDPYVRGGYATVVENWDGSKWTLTPSANPGGSSGGANTLDGVACVGANACTAVGLYAVPGGAGTTLVVRRD